MAENEDRFIVEEFGETFKTRKYNTGLAARSYVPQGYPLRVQAKIALKSETVPRAVDAWGKPQQVPVVHKSRAAMKKTKKIDDMKQVVMAEKLRGRPTQMIEDESSGSGSEEYDPALGEALKARGKKKGIQRASTRFSVKSSAMFDPRKTLREKFMDYFRDDKERTHEEREASRKRRGRAHISLNPERFRALPSEEVIQFPQFGTTSLTYLWEIFCKFDNNGDGTGPIDGPTFCKLLNSLGVDCNYSEASYLLKQFDLNQSGTLDFEDFAFYFNSCTDKLDVKEVVDRYRSSPPGTNMWKVLKECGETPETIGLDGCKEVDKLMNLEFRDDKELEDLFFMLDVDNSGILEAVEFAEFFQRSKNRKRLRGLTMDGAAKGDAKFLKRMYAEFDASRTGEMDEKDMMAVLRFCGVKADNKSVNALMRDIDTNFDGKISEAEFLKFFYYVQDVSDLVTMMNESQDRKFRKAVMTYFCVFLASIMEGFLVLLLWENGPALEVGDYSIDRNEIVQEEMKTALYVFCGVMFVTIFLCAGFGPMVYIFINICMPLGSIIRLFLLKGSYFMCFVTVLLLLANLLLNFENPTLLVALGVSAGMTAFCLVALGISLIAKRCWWFTAIPDDADLEEKPEEELASKKKKKKGICRRIWLWVTGKSAYEDMIRKIMVRSTETEIDNTIEHIPEPEPPVPEVGGGEGGNDKTEGKNRRGR
jgi:Ca2+-binding EF-hand superfamily protein